MTRTVVVTGAHGFVGRHVARAFANAGFVVTGIGHGSWNQPEFRRFGLTFWHTSDVTLDALMTYAGEPDFIIHCAGSGSVPFSMSHPYQDYVRTVSATAAVLEYVRLHSSRTAVVYPSSAAVHGKVQRLPIRETDALNPVSPYGVHKCMAEDLCRSYAANFNLSVAIVRFFSVYGEGLEKQLLWDACNKARAGIATFFGTGSELRDWLHVEDAARLLQAASSHASSSCPVVNGATGEGVTVGAILAEIFREFSQVPAPTFNGTPRPGDPKGYQADITAAKAWGWNPSVDWRDGMRRYVGWFKEHSQ